MSFKVGDKVKMSKYGLGFYSNLHHMIDVYKRPLINRIDAKDAEQMICELMSIHGVGTIIKLEEEDAVVKFTNSMNGVFFYHKGLYSYESISKLTLFEKLKLNLFGRL